jgi:dolichyl-phosphate-mannose-protein mannosyltransferase
LVWLLAPLLLAALGLRVVHLDLPSDYAIFDEIYYLNAARVLIGLPPRSAGQNLTRVGVPVANIPYAGAPKGVDPNAEHPPLGKLILALSIYILGDNPVAWRLPSAILGTFAIVCVYGLARALRAPPGVSLLAAFLCAFDNMVFVLSRIGMLDIGVIAFLLAGCWAYVSRKPLLAACAMAIATLIKLTGLEGMTALVLFELGAWAVARARAWRAPVLGLDAKQGSFGRLGFRRLGLALLVYSVTVLGLLWAMDARWTLFTNPVRHMQYMTQQAARLARPQGPLYDESYPWQWLANDTEINLFKREVDVPGTRPPTKRTLIWYRGAMNPFVLAMAPLALGSAAWLAWTSGNTLALFSVCLFLATYFSNVPAALAGRVEYIYYFAMAVPAVALASAQFLWRYLPAFVTVLYAAAVLFGFYEYFPLRQLATPWLFH